MAKSIKSAHYICSSCGALFSTWSGRCEQCGNWNTLELQNKIVVSHSAHKLNAKVLSASSSIDEDRIKIGISSIDKVFGGGIVKGSVTLLSGEPGMGKSTLLMQIAAAISKNLEVLYVSGEESQNQVAARAARLNVDSKNLFIAATNSVDDIAQAILTGKNKLVIVDSIQTLACNDVNTAAGSVSQVTLSASMLTNAAKLSSVAVIIVGHVTKEGNIAGPKLLEHVVDVVMALEGEISGGLKLLRASKNRYGTTNETAIFDMRKNGLIPVLNPSALLLAERMVSDGSVVLAAVEGSRPILVEVQALVSPTAYGYPKRAASGFDLARLNLLLAMLERRSSLQLKDKDVYLNIVGGLKINEPAADLAVVAAIVSAAKEIKITANAVFFGEVGLSGEVRHVPFMAKRIVEAKNMGFDFAVGPNPPRSKSTPLLKPLRNINQLLTEYLS